MTIREATLEDIPVLVGMGQEFLAASEYAAMIANNPSQMAAMGTFLINHPDGVVFIMEDGEQALGMIGLYCSTHFISGEIFAGEVFWWVDSKGKGRGLKLLKVAETWAKSKGAGKLQMISPNERVGQLYTKLGYGIVETTYQKIL